MLIYSVLINRSRLPSEKSYFYLNLVLLLIIITTSSANRQDLVLLKFYVHNVSLELFILVNEV